MKILDTFAGIGGFSYAAERLIGGFETTQFIEIDPFCQKVLKKHWPHVPIHDDIRTFTAKPKEYQVICGGFPCQDISVAGLQKGITEETRSGLFFELMRVIRMVRPQYVVLENVAAILNRGLDIVLRELSEAGYDAEWSVIPASSVGACHKRSRWWLVAYPNSKQSNRTESKIQRRRNPTFSSSTSNTNSFRCGGGSSERRTVSKRKFLQREQTGSEMGSETQRCSINTSNPNSIGTQSKDYKQNNASWKMPISNGKTKRTLNPNWREYVSEPCLLRGNDGLRGRVDRLKALGNSVVPQVAAIPLQRVKDIHEQLTSVDR